jgi:hypothetical protein
MLSKILLFILIFMLFYIFVNFANQYIKTDNNMNRQLIYLLLGLVFASFIYALSMRENYEQVFPSLMPRELSKIQKQNLEKVKQNNYNTFNKYSHLVGYNTVATPFLTPDERSYTDHNCPEVYTSCNAFLTAPLSDNTTFCSCNK